MNRELIIFLSVLLVIVVPVLYYGYTVYKENKKIMKPAPGNTNHRPLSRSLVHHNKTIEQ
jgi:hypothetical protein